jgi:hypothetical protein
VLTAAARIDLSASRVQHTTLCTLLLATVPFQFRAIVSYLLYRERPHFICFLRKLARSMPVSIIIQTTQKSIVYAVHFEFEESLANLITLLHSEGVSAIYNVYIDLADLTSMTSPLAYLRSFLSDYYY